MASSAVIALVPVPVSAPAHPAKPRAFWRTALRRGLHVHRCAEHRDVGVFAHHRCRCGAVQLVWFTGRHVRWASSWAGPDAVREELRRHASEARTGERS